MHPKPKALASEILQELLESAGSKRRRATLLRLQGACDDLCAQQRPFRLSDIQRKIESMFGRNLGPKAQTISNEKRNSLGMYHYVEARMREVALGKLPDKQRGRSSATSIADAIDVIEDVDVRSRLRDLYESFLLKSKQLERAKVLLKTIRPTVDLERLGEGELAAVLQPVTSLKAEHKASIKRIYAILTDEKRLDLVGLTYDAERVRRKSGTRDELVDRQTLRSLRSFVASFDDPSEQLERPSLC